MIGLTVGRLKSGRIIAAVVVVLAVFASTGCPGKPLPRVWGEARRPRSARRPHSKINFNGICGARFPAGETLAVGRRARRTIRRTKNCCFWPTSVLGRTNRFSFRAAHRRRKKAVASLRSALRTAECLSEPDRRRPRFASRRPSGNHRLAGDRRRAGATVTRFVERTGDMDPAARSGISSAKPIRPASKSGVASPSSRNESPPCRGKSTAAEALVRLPIIAQRRPFSSSTGPTSALRSNCPKVSSSNEARKRRRANLTSQSLVLK